MTALAEVTCSPYLVRPPLTTFERRLTDDLARLQRAARKVPYDDRNPDLCRAVQAADATIEEAIRRGWLPPR